MLPPGSKKIFVFYQKKKKLMTFIVIIKTTSMTVWVRAKSKTSVCMQTVDSNTWLHIMKYIV